MQADDKPWHFRDWSPCIFRTLCIGLRSICCTVSQVSSWPQRHPGSSFLSLCASTILCIELVKVLRQSRRWFTWPPCCRSRRWCQGGQTSTWGSSLPTVQCNCSSLFLHPHSKVKTKDKLWCALSPDSAPRLQRWGKSEPVCGLLTLNVL